MSTNDKSADKEPGKNAINETMLDDEFSLETQKALLSATLPQKESPRKSSPGNNNKGQASEVLSYRYDDKRTNNPHVGMVDTYSDGVEAQKTWQYDPHIDPALNFDSCRSTVENLPLRDAIDFYKQERDWANRLIVGQVRIILSLHLYALKSKGT